MLQRSVHIAPAGALEAHEPSATFDCMSSALPESHDVVCPHCKKQFTGELMGGDDERHQGYKCPHCRLFVPIERAAEPKS